MAAVFDIYQHTELTAFLDAFGGQNPKVDATEEKYIIYPKKTKFEQE